MQRVDKRKYHYIYKITRDDGRFYIGMHSTDVLEDGYFGSGKLITRSIKKHGIERHSKEVLEFCDSRKQLSNREKEIITHDVLAEDMCMNIALGGENPFSFEICSNAGKIGGKVSGPANAKILGQKFGAMNLSKTIQNPIAKQKALEARLRYFHDTPIANRRANEESREAQRKAFEKCNHQQGEKNSQFGTCWVTNGVKPVKIKKEQLNEYLAKGFIQGRKSISMVTVM